ncbi:MAG: terminase [Candidatus Cloacimonadota bacterium]|nr:MAG: terminase [Candidatus Cloacimonadota bacterium]
MKISKVVKSLLKIFNPPPRLKVSEWADKYRKLSAESSSEPGQWNTDRAPYQRGLMDAVNEKGIEDIAIMASAQVGKTAMIENVIAYYIDQDPAPMLLIQPTLEMAQTFSKDRLSPMIRDTPKLAGKIADAKTRNSGNTLLHKTFQSGHITMAGANSAAGLASRPIRIVLFDEVDRYPDSAGTEGDPVKLGEKRTKTFYNRKKIKTSTPTVKDASRIESDFLEGDQRRYFVPCPHCNYFQHLQWEFFKWEKDKPETTYYQCEKCEKAIHEKDKYKIVRNGEWRATAKSKDPKKISFHIWEAYSPWSTWKEIVSTFLLSKQDPEQLKTWINTTLGQTWDEQQGEQVKAEDFLSRVEPYSLEQIPQRVLVLTCGVDVQPDRLEYQIVGWGSGEESWVMDHKIIYGSPENQKTWDDLDVVLGQTYQSEHGVLTIACTCVDSGGANTDAVYRFCKPREIRRIYAVKGQSQAGKHLVGRATKSNKAKVNLFPVGSDTAKDCIFGRLKLENIGMGYIHFADCLDEEFFMQLTAEKVVTKYHKGRQKREWVKTRKRNEALDCNVYALVAVKILNPNWQSLVSNKKAIAKEKEIKRPTKKRLYDARKKRKNFVNS